jgi:hypothetical protein
MAIRKDRVQELVLQALQTEQGGIEVYETAVECAENDELRDEWEKYLEQTRHHEQVVLDLCSALGIDPEESTPGRDVVLHIGKSLVQAMRKALATANRAAAQLVAAECVVLAETKDHTKWEFLGAARAKQQREEML